MRFIIIPYIALGLVLSVAIGIEYNFNGEEMMPKYWGSPFVYKQESLGSSLERYYSVVGLILNVVLWSLLLFLIEQGIKSLNLTEKYAYPYKVIIILLIAFSSLNILFDYSLLANGFEENLNYWYWDIDNEAKVWDGKYEGEFTTFRK